MFCLLVGWFHFFNFFFGGWGREVVEGVRGWGMKMVAVFF